MIDRFKISIIILIGISVYFPILFIFMSSFFLLLYSKKIDNYFIFFYTVITFTLIFYYRQYGIYFLHGATDDVKPYVFGFSILRDVGYMDFFYIALNHYGHSSMEPFYWLVFYIIGLLSDFNANVFVFMNYFLSITLVLFFFKKFFHEKYLLGFLFVITFNIHYYELTIHIFRQSLAFGLLLLSIYYLSEKKPKISFLFVILSFLTHFTSIIMVIIFFIYNFLFSNLKLNHKIMLTVIAVMILFGGLQYFDTILLKLEGYRSNVTASIRLNYWIKFGGALIISVVLFLKSLKLNDLKLKILSFYMIVGNTILLFFASNSLITTRLQLIFNSIFLIMIFYYITKYHNKNTFIYIFLIIIIFIKFIFLTTNDDFVARFLLYGDFNEVIFYSLRDFLNLDYHNIDLERFTK